MTPSLKPPVWFAALLVIEGLLALLASAALAIAFLMFTTQPTSVDMALVVIVAAMPLGVTIGLATLGWRLWRQGKSTAGIVVGVLPPLIALPFVAFLLGISF